LALLFVVVVAFAALVDFLAGASLAGAALAADLAAGLAAVFLFAFE